MNTKSKKMTKRSIVCVDGTWFDPDGRYGNRDRNVTNMYRMYASIGQGTFDGLSGESYSQTKKYFNGIGADGETPFGERMTTGMFGKPCLDQIREVYEYCCTSAGEHDELWLFGFSRGAFVVRAVAGILHHIRALKSAGTPQFKKDFKLALKTYKRIQAQENFSEGQTHHMIEGSTSPAATIKFVGVFDTVKAVDDQRLYDISFNPSIKHMRHALALNEDRKRFKPEYLYPNFNTRSENLKTRTFIQAWFVGGHADMGGSSKMDGLSLYPLQWMLIECQSQGLHLRFDGLFGGRCKLDNPLEITGLDGTATTWTCETQNGLTFEMKDILHIHEELERTKRYAIHLNRSRGQLWIRKYREPFEDSELNGFCCHGSQGTIIHPSVYLILDKFMHISLEAKHFPFYLALQQWRRKVLGMKDDRVRDCYWNSIPDRLELQGPGAVRILVCGNAGVGKSSLINHVFGVKATTVSHRKAGEHQIEDELTAEGRKDLIVHDSNGFEAGGDEELRRVQNFVREKSSEGDVEKRLHLIWYCVETNTARACQTAQYELFKSLSQYAQDVPIVVVATKKDEFLDIKEGQRKRELKKHGQPVDCDDLENYAALELRDRLALMEGEFSEFGQLDALVAVSKDDVESISDLSATTAQLFSHDRIRLLYISAQAVRLDMKVDLAVAQAVKVYKSAWISSTCVGVVPLALSTNRGATAIDLCRVVVESFGVPTIPAQAIWQIISTNLWDDARNSVRIFIAEACAAAGMTLTVLTAGMPFFLIPMAINPTLAIVATSRLIAMLACDIIMILIRAFSEAAAKSIGKPEMADIEAAALIYSQYCSDVHARVKAKLSNTWKCSQKGEIDSWITEIIGEFKGKVLEGVGSPVTPAAKLGCGVSRMPRRSSSFTSSESTIW